MISWRNGCYRFFAFLAFLAAFFAFFAIGLIPPFRLGYAEGAAAPPRRFCRLALSPRVPAPSRLSARGRPRAMSCPRAVPVRAEEKVGQCSRETAPLQSGRLTSSLPSWPSWPPSSLSSPLFLLKGSCSCLMATSAAGSAEQCKRVSAIHNPLSEPSALIPDVDYG